MYRSTTYISKITLLMLLLIASWGFGQRHELGVRAGHSNLVGDVGRTNYLLQMPIFSNVSQLGLPLYIGVLYRMNFNPHQTLRFDLGYSQVQFSDLHAKELYRRQRGRYGTNNGIDADVLFEYNFFPVNNEQKGMLSPYIFGGVGASLYSVRKLTFTDTATDDATQPQLTRITEGFGRKMMMTVPFGIGLKYKFNYNWALSAEAMFRPFFSDSIDYSVIEAKDTAIRYNTNNVIYSNRETRPAYVQEAKQQVSSYIDNRNIGNKNSNDWVNSVTLSLTYSFGRPPCYCDQ